MKLFVVSDVHSFLGPLKTALNNAGFDPNNQEHYLVSCGDLFDRGPNSEELLYYIMSLDRKILVKGNHDLLLDDCCIREFPYSHDFSNGTFRTISDIGGAGEGYSFDKCCERTWNKTAAYRDLLVNYFETENYIFVHSWIPLTCLDTLPKHYIKNRRFDYNSDWRNANSDDWEQAMWGNPFALAEMGFNQTGKTIVFGHWHCSTGWSKIHNLSEFGEDAVWKPYVDDEHNFIGIDACTAHTGLVNVLVIEDNFLTKEGN
jgi:serine/threonine protein phosphatase 1